MRTYKILVIYPGMYQKDYTITGTLQIFPTGQYHILDSDGYHHYFPVALTIIESIKSI